MIDFHILIPIARAAESTAAPAGVAGALGINLKLFIAQLVNFGVILFVLWRWVFTPVAKKLTERTEKIEKSLRDAAGTEKEKNEFHSWKETEMIKVRSQAQAIITAAQSEAGKAKKQIKDETRVGQQKIVEQAKDQIQQEKQTALREAKTELADLVTNATEKILRHKLDEHKDKELIKESLRGIS